MEPDEIVNGLRERGHHVASSIKDGETVLDIDGSIMTLTEAQALLTDEIDVEEP